MKNGPKVKRIRRNRDLLIHVAARIAKEKWKKSLEKMWSWTDTSDGVERLRFKCSSKKCFLRRSEAFYRNKFVLWNLHRRD